MAGMALGLVGGCAFPASQLPAFLREHITPLMPSYWFVDTARNLQYGGANVAWGLVALKLVLLSVVLVALAALLFRRRFKMGLRA
jgi:ABC-type multidrug transport system permease subunit